MPILCRRGGRYVTKAIRFAAVGSHTTTREHRDEVVARLHDYCAKHNPIVIIGGRGLQSGYVCRRVCGGTQHSMCRVPS
jgi:hypothetical protein